MFFYPYAERKPAAFTQPFYNRNLFHMYRPECLIDGYRRDKLYMEQRWIRVFSPGKSRFNFDICGYRNRNFKQLRSSKSCYSKCLEMPCDKSSILEWQKLEALSKS